MELVIRSGNNVTYRPGEYTTICDRCEMPTNLGETVYVERSSGWRNYSEQTWCRDCVSTNTQQCECCRNNFSTKAELLESYELYTGEVVLLCSHCEFEEYHECYQCGRLVHTSEVAYDDDDDPYCPYCMPYDSENVAEYDHTDAEVFWYIDDTGRECDDGEYDDGRLYIGVELETSENRCRGELADNIIGKFGYSMFECKKDSTIGKTGLEIVSQPMTPRFHLETDTWQEIKDFVREQGGTSYDNGRCGLHMHLNRSALEEDTPYRIDRLLHRFRDEFINFSRRGYDLSYCKLEDDDLADIADVEKRKAEWSKKKGHDRYVALNLDNYDTIEVRLWRGTLNMESFRATIEMTAGLAWVCNAISNEFADELDWERLKLLVRYALEEHHLTHEDLDNYFKRRRL